RGMIDRMVGRQSGRLDDLTRAHTVEFDPYILPGQFRIGNIGVDLPGEDHESLSAPDLIFMRDAFGIVGYQSAGPGEDIVEQIVVSCGRSERICGRTLFHSVLVQAQVNEVLIREYGK